MQILLSIVALSGIAFQAPADPKKPPPDRSGEPELRRVIEATAALRNVRFHVVTSAQDVKGGTWYADSNFDVWYAEPGRYRVEIMDMWGDGLMLVSDGKSLLKDTESEWTPVTLAKTPKGFLEAEAQLGWSGDRTSPLFYFLDGPSSLEKLASKADAVVQLEPMGAWKRVQFSHSVGGTITVFYVEEKGRPVVRRFEYDKLAYLQSMHKQYPDWYDEPQQPMTRQTVWIEPIGKAGDKLFDTTPPKGRQVQDSRSTAEAKPPKVR